MLPRILALCLMLPFFSNNVTAFAVRGGLGLAFAIFCAPVATQWSGVLQLGGLGLFVFIMKELAIGATIGLGLSVTWHAFSSAGSLVDNIAGTSNSNVLDPATHQEQTIYSSFFGVLVTALLLSSGFLQICVGAIVWSYTLFPPNEWIAPANLLKMSAWSGKTILEMTLQLAAPFIVLMGVLDILLGLINRFVQQWTTQTVSTIIRPLLVLLMITVSIGQLAEYTTQKFTSNWAIWQEQLKQLK